MKKWLFENDSSGLQSRRRGEPSCGVCDDWHKDCGTRLAVNFGVLSGVTWRAVRFLAVQSYE